MNNSMNQNRTIERIKAELNPALDELLTMLHADTLPDDETASKIQELLREYLAASDYEKQFKQRFGSVIFTDCPVHKVTETDVIGELSGKKEDIAVLNKIAMKKIVSCEDTDYPDAVLKRLLDKSYITKVSFQSPLATGEYFTLTSKGGMCITKKKLADKLAKDSNAVRVPSSFYYAPDKWTTVAFCKAAMLHEYYKAKGVGDFFTFAAPGKENTLLGCKISDEAEIRYVMPAVEDSSVMEQDMGYIQEATASDEIAGIMVLCTEDAKRMIKETYPRIANNAKVELIDIGGVTA